MNTAQKVWQRYASLPSTEIWNEEVIYDTLKQIEFYHECNFFENPKEAAFLCDQLISLLDTVQEEAANGVKSGGGEFNLYKNDILIATIPCSHAWVIPVVYMSLKTRSTCC